MSSTLAETSAPLDRLAAPGVDVDLVLVETKLRPPWSRPGLVLRSALVDRLIGSSAPIVTVIAPAGYGKTTLLGQWVGSTSLRSAWLSLDSQDDEPSVLLTSLLAALARIEPIEPDVERTLLAEAAVEASWSLRRLAALVSSIRTPFLMVLDHVEAVEDQRSNDLIAALALNLPTGSRLALASRAEPPIPMARLRSQGLVDEVGRDELMMDEQEAGDLLAGAGTPVETAAVRDLVVRTEGWPVGLYLASLAMRAGDPGTRPEHPVRGDDRLVADYLQAEVVSALDPSSLAFLTHTSVLAWLTAPLCDAVLETSGSQQVLESLEESNLLLVPLDRRREWYRCHHLLGELLRAELARSEPDLVPRLHDRAAAWFEANGHFELAIDHAQAAGDADRAARLFGDIGQMTHASGRAETARRWLAWFDERGLIERNPQVAVLGAMSAALDGGHATSRLLADAAASGDLRGLAPDGSPLGSWIAMMEACLCRGGADRMRADAEQAIVELSFQSTFRGPAAFLAGCAMLLQADAQAAGPVLATSAELCRLRGIPPTGAAALALRAVIAIERGDWDTARALSDEATAVVTSAQLDAYVQSLVVHAVAARIAARDGDVQQARAQVALAARVRPRCTAAAPWSALFLLQLAHAYLALADPAGARAVLRQVRDIVLTSPELGTVEEQCTELGRTLDTINVSSVGASSLTAAELRLLPLLATHLSYRDIGERLHVSRNTIKTEAISVFRKLGVSSRGEAVETAEQIGLMGR